MEINLEKLIAAGNDLNNVLKLEPPINTIFSTDLKGGAAKAVEAKFTRGLQTEIIQLAEFEDKETGKFDLQVGDLPLLQPETLETIFEISPKTKERLAPQEKVAEKKDKKKKLPKESLPKTENKSSSRAHFLFNLIQKGAIDKKSIAEKLHKEFGDSENESRFQAALSLQYLTAFAAVKEEDGKYSLTK